MKIRRIMNKTYLLTLMVALLAMSSCIKREVVGVQGKLLTVKEVPAEAGEFMVAVTVNEPEDVIWKARPIDNWLHVEDVLKKNNYAITIYYDSNESTENRRNFARVGRVVIDTYEGFTADTIIVKQRGLTPLMQLVDASVEASETECYINFNTNLTDDCRPTLTFEADAEWVESIEFCSNGTQLLVKLAANGGAERTATLTATFVDAWGNATTNTCVLTQKAL